MELLHFCLVHKTNLATLQQTAMCNVQLCKQAIKLVKLVQTTLIILGPNNLMQLFNDDWFNNVFFVR